MASRGPPRAGPFMGTSGFFPPAFPDLHRHLEIFVAPLARPRPVYPSSAAVLVARAPSSEEARGEAVTDFPSPARAGLRVRRWGGAARRVISASEGALS
jgi:hypothetical protein